MTGTRPNYTLVDKKRHIGIDILKLICAILVVFIHIPSEYTNIIIPITRSAVPCFFIISGYMLYENGLSKTRILRSLKKMIGIWISSTIIYLLFSLIIASQSGNWNILSLTKIFDFIAFNEHPFAFHLWYIDAYIYVLLFYLVYNVYGGGKSLPIWIVLILLTIDLILGKYSILFFNQSFEVKYTRNFLFVGIPYFTIGMMLKKYIKTTIYKKWCIFAVVASLILVYFEKYGICSYIETGLRDHYLSSSLLAISLFLFFLSLRIKRESIWSTLGKDYTLDLYIFHPLIYWIVQIGISHFPMIGEYLYMNTFGPFVVIMLSMLTIYLKKNIFSKYENCHFNIS